MITDAELRRAYLASRDYPCPGCRYNLRGLAGDSCPECNQALEFALLLAEPRLGALIGAIIGFAGAAAGGGALIVLFVIISLATGDWAPVPFMTAAGLPALVGAIGLVLIGRRAGRTWFRRAAATARRSVVIAAWVTLAAFLVAMTVVVLGQ